MRNRLEPDTKLNFLSFRHIPFSLAVVKMLGSFLDFTNSNKSFNTPQGGGSGDVEIKKGEDHGKFCWIV